jgi:hypothetical protein
VEQPNLERILLAPNELGFSAEEEKQVIECLRNPAVRHYLRTIMQNSVTDFLENTVLSAEDKEKLACRVLVLQGVRRIVSLLINLPQTATQTKGAK